ncbi:MAG: CHAT domain-containing protein [Cyanobacteria bacterium J06623_5]
MWPLFVAEFVRPTVELVRPAVAFEQSKNQLLDVQLTREPESDLVAASLVEEGLALTDAGESMLAAERFRTALALIDDADVSLRGKALYGLGYAHLYAEQFEQAIAAFEGAIAIYTEMSAVALAAAGLSQADRDNILIDIAGSLGLAHRELAHFGTAVDYYQQALSDEDRLQPPTRAALLANLGTLEAEIGQYAQAEETLQQAIWLSRTEGLAEQAATAAAALGWVYERQGKFDRAIASYETAIALFQQMGDSRQETRTVNNIGIVALKQGRLEAARSALNRALALLETADDPVERAIVLDSFGSLYQAEGDLEKAWQSYRQALALSRRSGDKVGEIEVLLNLGALMEAEGQPSLAILFYKQAVEKTETIRVDLQRLSQAVQQRYTQTIEDFYRNLADLLLQQNRVPEALQILELLKLQEVSAYLHSNQTAGKKVSVWTLLLTQPEKTAELRFRLLPPETALTDFFNLPEIVEAGADLEKRDAERTYNQQSIESLQSTLASQPVKTAALYPLILSDRLEIIFITAEGTPIHRTTAVTAKQLTDAVGQLQKLLSTDVLEAEATAQTLYDWLIRPLETTIAEQDIENIIYLPDGALRYVPLAALHDGQQWFAQTYQSHNITAAGIDELTTRQSGKRPVLAGAFTDQSPAHTVQVGQERFTYDGLPAARQEVDRVMSAMGNTTILLDQAFTPAETLAIAQENRIVHLATHAKFLPGQPEESFILFGDGSTVNLREVGEWVLPNVELLVLSACQTATTAEGDGKELLGLGFQVNQTGAGSAIASLWAVDDVSTAVLMNQFYQALSAGKTKAEALQTAQQALSETDRFSHPHHWAAFILIGNGQ